MTETQLEALIKRAGIFEFDTGLDRKTALIKAAAELFPAEFHAMKENAAGHADADALIFAYLDGLINPSQTRKNGLVLNAETKNASQHESPPETGLAGLSALSHFIEKGIALIGAYDTAATINNTKIAGDYEKAFTADFKTIENLWTGQGDKEGRARGNPIRRFYFLPAAAGFLCLDIDRKNEKDGIAEFYARFPKRLLPRLFQDIPRSFPCYVETPSGGFHLYFKYRGAAPEKAALSPAVEIKHGKRALTAAGSYKDDKPYILRGRLKDAPRLPPFLQTEFFQKPPETKRTIFFNSAQKKPTENKPEWSKIVEYAEKDYGGFAGRNDKAFRLSVKARDHGYRETETEAAIRAMEWNFDKSFTETALFTCVKSAYKNKRSF